MYFCISGLTTTHIVLQDIHIVQYSRTGFLSLQQRYTQQYMLYTVASIRGADILHIPLPSQKTTKLINYLNIIVPGKGHDVIV